MFGKNTVWLDKQGKQTRSEVTIPEFSGYLNRQELITRYYEYYGIHKGVRNTVWNKLFSRHIAEKVAFREDLTIAEDVFYCIDALALADSLLVVPESFYTYCSQSSPKAYYDADVQISYDRDLEIKNKVVAMGVDEKKAEDEYYHQVLYTAYNHCMLTLRSKNPTVKDAVNDIINKLNRLETKKQLEGMRFSERIIKIASTLPTKELRFFFLEAVRLSVKTLRG